MRPAAVSLVALLVCAGSPAAAQPPWRPPQAHPGDGRSAGRPTQEERRETLFREGKSLASQGKWADAADKFRQVIAIRSAPKALIALALAEEAQGQLVAAKQHFAKAESDARAQSLADDRDLAARALESLSARIPRAILKLPADVRSFTVRVDGQPTEPLDKGVELDPGSHVIEVQAEGRHAFRAKVRLGELERTDLAVSLPVVAAAPVAKPSDADEGASKAPPVGAVVTGGLGLLTAGVGVGFILMGRSQESEIDEICGGDPCPKSLEDDADTAATNIIAGDVLVGVGAAAVVAGGVWWIVSATRSPAKPANAALVVVPLPGGGWAGATGRF